MWKQIYNFAQVFETIPQIMDILLRFTVENFRSIGGSKTIIFVPSAIKDAPGNNIAQCGAVRYLKTAAIYGANSSGKSNLIRALAVMRHIVRSSVKINDQDTLPYEPFALSATDTLHPTKYEVDFITDSIHYIYGFSNYEHRICEEWLTRIEPSGKETRLFIRTLEGIGINENIFAEGKDLEERTNDNRLFISLVGQLGGKISNAVITFFSGGLNVISGLDTDSYRIHSEVVLSQNKPICANMKDFFRRIQLGFSDIAAVEHEFEASDIPSDVPKELKAKLLKDLSGKKQIKVFSTHGVYDSEGRQVSSRSFDFDEMESAGTQKIFDLAGPIFDTLSHGSILVVDELDAKMHPLISREIVSLFNDPERNVKGAQLIFTTHDTNLLSARLLRRDQIWFTEKDEQERTDLYNIMQIVLPDGKKPRGDGNIERNYIRGRYGAIPYIQTSID